MTAPSYILCDACAGDGCPACDYVGTFTAYRPAATPRRTSSPTVPLTGPALLVIARDGTAATGAGDDRWTFPRWALCLSRDGKTPARRWRNGGPVGVLRPVSGKRPPEWMARAVAYVAAVGGVTEGDAVDVAEWYRTHRSGSYMARVA